MNIRFYAHWFGSKVAAERNAICHFSSLSGLKKT